MTSKAVKPLFLLCILLLVSACSKSIRLTGYGQPVDIQHGLKLELIANGNEGALIKVLNTTEEIVSINKHILSMEIKVTSESKPVKPCGRIMINVDTGARPDDFVIIGPGQTAEIRVPVSMEGAIYSTIHEMYEFKKGRIYDVEVTLLPYFGQFKPENSREILSKFRIPNYLNKPLTTNSMGFKCY